MSAIKLVSRSQAAILVTLAVALFVWLQAGSAPVVIEASGVNAPLANAAAPQEGTLSDVQRAFAAVPTSEPQAAPRGD